MVEVLITRTLCWRDRRARFDKGGHRRYIVLVGFQADAQPFQCERAARTAGTGGVTPNFPSLASLAESALRSSQLCGALPFSIRCSAPR